MSLPSDRFIQIKTATRTQQQALLEGLHTWLNLGLIREEKVSIRIFARDDVTRSNTLLVDIALNPTERFLAGLDAWLQMGLLSQVQLSVEVQVRASAPDLLTGLDAWLRLGLLSQAHILRVCQSHLTCPLPPITPQVIPTPVHKPSISEVSNPSPEVQSPEIQPRQPEPRSQPIASFSPLPRGQRPPNRLEQILQSLVAELSILWLLLLGVFMVVVSSGVLAANQWERFPSVIQYGILWLYTLGFWGSSVWAGQHSNLRLTTQGLRIITLLLMPLNFLAIDSVGLWRSPMQWLVMAIATASLTWLTTQIFRARSPSPTLRSGINIPLLAHLGLSYLHIGWGIAGFPLMATYVGVVGATFLSRYGQSQLRGPEPISAGAPPSSPAPFSLNGAVIIYATGIILLRALFIAHLPVVRLGLAMGLCGWLLIQQKPQVREVPPSQPTPQGVWEWMGGSLLLLGWLLSVGTIPWQALVVSGLAVLVFAQRVLRNWARGELSAALLIGLQMVWLAWRMVPATGRQMLIDWATRLTGTEAVPEALLGIALLPYLGLILALFDGLMQIRRRQLAYFAGRVAAAFGVALMVLSLASPLLRIVNFGFSTLALGIVTRQQHRRNLGSERQRHMPVDTVRSLAALTHLGGLFTLFWAIDWQQPRLGWVPWAGIGLGLMVWEGWLSLGQPLEPIPDAPPTTLSALLRQSSWNLSLLLGGLSYVCLLVNLIAPAHWDDLWGHPLGSPGWGGLWLITPLMLTGVIARVRTRRELACGLSVAALVLAQGLTLAAPEVRLLSLGFATGLMLVNARYLQKPFAAVLTVGFGLSFVGVLIGQLWPGLTLADWMLLGAIATLALWLLRHGLTRRATQMAALYGQASDGWAIALSSIELLLLTNPTLSPLWALGIAPIQALPIALLLMVAVAYRSWQTRQPPALWLSVAALLMAQIPFLAQPAICCFSLAVATLLMVVQTRLLRHWAAAAITVGLILSLASTVLWMELPTPVRASPTHWLLIAAIALTGLWVWRHGLIQRNTQLARLYAQAADGWAIALCSLDLGILAAEFVSGLGIDAAWEFQATIVTVTLALLMVSSVYRTWQPIRSAQALQWGVVVLLVAQVPMIAVPSDRLLLLGLATALMLAHTRYLKTRVAAGITVGMGLGVIGLCLWDGVGTWRVESFEGWLLAIAIAVTGLWLLRSGLLRRSTQLPALYGQALDGWAVGLASLALIGLTLHSLLVYWEVTPASRLAMGSAAVTLGAITYRTWKHPTNWTLSGLGWSLELLALEVLGMTGRSIIALAIANTALGLLTQILGDWWHRRTDRPVMLSCWHVLPLVYGGLGSALRWNLLANWTGLSSLGLVLIVIGVGRRQAVFKPLLYLAVTGISLSAYELLMFQVRGLPLGDQLLAMAALTTTIMYAYRLLTPWLTGYLRLIPTELRIISHVHWGLGSLLLTSAVSYPVELNRLLGLGTCIFLTRYAIMQGRNHDNRMVGEVWTYVGILEATGVALYAALTTPVLSRMTLLGRPWAGAIASWAAVIVYLLPWQQWGWSSRPWRLAAILAPLITIGTNLIRSSQPPNFVSLLAMAGFYGWLAWRRCQARWLYCSLLLIDWAVWLFILPENSPFLRTCLIGLSILSVTWFEPVCRSQQGRSLRHILRCVGIGMIGIDALIIYHQPGIIPGIVGLVGIFLGLGLRIRAFLYVGTVTFLAIALYQMVILIFAYPMVKWMIGLATGLVFIWIAASFETRRYQFIAMLNHWLIEFREWE